MAPPVGTASVKANYKQREPIELTLRVRERLTLLSKEGSFWYIARNMHGEEGYVPAGYISVDGHGPLELLYKQWQMNCDKVLAKGSITMSDWHSIAIPKDACTCSDFSCRTWKGDSRLANNESHSGLGACVHDVESLLRSDTNYSAGQLKTERLRWHPDRFRAKCSIDAKDALGKRAAELFTILTTLYEKALAQEACTSSVRPPRASSDDILSRSRADPTAETGSSNVKADEPARPPSRTPSPVTTASSAHSGMHAPTQSSFTSPSPPAQVRQDQVQAKHVQVDDRQSRCSSSAGTAYNTTTAWSQFATLESTLKGEDEPKIDEAETFDAWFNANTSTSNMKAHHEAAVPSYQWEEVQQHHTLKSRAKGKQVVCTPTGETEDQRMQRLLPVARRVRAGAIRKLKESLYNRTKGPPHQEIQEHQHEHQRAHQQEHDRELRTSRRAKWGRGEALEDRVARQEADKEKAQNRG